MPICRRGKGPDSRPSEVATRGASDSLGEVGSEEADLLAMLEASAERERRARERLIEARDELNDRDDAFAALEAEMWARVEEHERGVQGELAELRDENAALREVQRGLAELRGENAALRLHLAWILASPPERLYTKLKQLPVLRVIAAWRGRKFAAELNKVLQH